MINFHDWLQQNESLARDYRPPASDFQWVYFGIHDLSRYASEHKTLPQWSIQEMMPKMRPVVHTEPNGAPDGGMMVWVKSDKSPSQFRYMRLADNGAKVKKQRDGTLLIGIPADWIEDISGVIGQDGSPEGQQLGLVFDRGTRHQTGLIRMIRATKQAMAQAQPQPITPSAIANVKKALGFSRGTDLPVQSRPESPDQLWAKLGIPPEPKSPQTGPLAGAMARIKAKQQMQQMFGEPEPEQPPIPMNPFRQTASYDPSVRAYAPYWKNHNDTQFYNYIID